jgi:hypothetical protein
MGMTSKAPPKREEGSCPTRAAGVHCMQSPNIELVINLKTA